MPFAAMGLYGLALKETWGHVAISTRAWTLSVAECGDFWGWLRRIDFSLY